MKTLKKIQNAIIMDDAAMKNVTGGNVERRSCYVHCYQSDSAHSISDCSRSTVRSYCGKEPDSSVSCACA